MKLLVLGLNPFTVSNVPSGRALPPQPLMLLSPLIHSSRPPRRLTVENWMARRRSKSAGRQLSCSAAVGAHGPVQVLRPAIWPSWDCKHFLALPDVEASRLAMPLAIEVSVVVAGLNTNARSLPRDPSPLMSPATDGV